MKKKALITGATGFIGSNLTRKLVELNWDVYIIVRKESYNFWRIRDITKIKRIYLEDIHKDSIKTVDGEEIPQFDVCFHLAASGVNYYNQSINNILDGNIGLITKVIEFCYRNKTKKVINTGSCFEYGNHEKIKLKETSYINSKSLYGTAKISSTFIGNAYAMQLKVPLITLRPFGVYGEYEGNYRLVPQLINAIKNNKAIELTPGEQVRDYLYVQDLIDAYITVANADLEGYEIYNVCSGVDISIRNIVEVLCEITGASPNIFLFSRKEYRPNEMMYLVGDNSKLKLFTGWVNKHSIREGLKKTYQWHVNNEIVR